MVVLRNMLESDIEDYVRWFTVDVDWMNTDAPWEKTVTTAEAERQNWTEYYESVKDLPDDTFKWKFEIESDGKHVGWVCWYTDLEYMENPEEIPAVGIDIPEIAFRGRGVGTEALRLLIRYLKDSGVGAVFTQTWSGNAAMMRVAEKLGFAPYCRMKDHRTVDGKKYDAVTFKLNTKNADF